MGNFGSYQTVMKWFYSPKKKPFILTNMKHLQSNPTMGFLLACFFYSLASCQSTYIPSSRCPIVRERVNHVPRTAAF
jgi:hypothetical protein